MKHCVVPLQQAHQKSNKVIPSPGIMATSKIWCECNLSMCGSSECCSEGFQLLDVQNCFEETILRLRETDERTKAFVALGKVITAACTTAGVPGTKQGGCASASDVIISTCAAHSGCTHFTVGHGCSQQRSGRSRLPCIACITTCSPSLSMGTKSA